MHVARQAIQLGDDDGTFPLAGLGERRRKPRATIERVRSLAGFDLDEMAGDLETLGLREAGERRLLRFQPEPGLALARCRNPDVADDLPSTIPFVSVPNLSETRERDWQRADHGEIICHCELVT